jgi:hypothetical protein
MSTIIQKQYETAKQLLKTVEFCLRYYEKCGKTQKDFDYFYNNVTSLLTIFGHVHVGMSVIQGERASDTSIIDDCRQRFAAYEAELMQAGLIASKWEQILADVEPTEPSETIEYSAEQEAQMWYEHMKQF